MAEKTSDKKSSEWVKIVSRRDGHSFIVPRDVAMISGFLKNTFDPEGGFVEGTQNTCVVEER
jgi:transcription elongation factor B subunit 1